MESQPCIFEGLTSQVKENDIIEISPEEFLSSGLSNDTITTNDIMTANVAVIKI